MGAGGLKFAVIFCHDGSVMLASLAFHAVHHYSGAGPYPHYGGNFPEEIPERPQQRSQSVSWNSTRGVRLGSPKPYNSRHLRLPEHFQKSLPLSTVGDASFLGSGPGEGLSELLMKFPAVLRVSEEDKAGLLFHGCAWMQSASSQSAQMCAS